MLYNVRFKAFLVLQIFPHLLLNLLVMEIACVPSIMMYLHIFWRDKHSLLLFQRKIYLLQVEHVWKIHRKIVSPSFTTLIRAFFERVFAQSYVKWMDACCQLRLLNFMSSASWRKKWISKYHGSFLHSLQTFSNNSAWLCCIFIKVLCTGSVWYNLRVYTYKPI